MSPSARTYDIIKISLAGHQFIDVVPACPASALSLIDISRGPSHNHSNLYRSSLPFAFCYFKTLVSPRQDATPIHLLTKKCHRPVRRLHAIQRERCCQSKLDPLFSTSKLPHVVLGDGYGEEGMVLYFGRRTSKWLIRICSIYST